MIRRSLSKEVDALLADLASESVNRRDSAVARLTVIGTRAVQRLLTLAGDRQAPPIARAAALRTLEAIADPAGLKIVLDTFDEPDVTVASAAIGAARALLTASHGDLVLDRLTALALDHKRPVPLRVSALQALSDLDKATIKPLLATLRQDPEPEIVAAAQPGAARKLAAPAEQIREAANGQLPADPVSLKRAIAGGAAEVPVATLHKLIAEIRIREGSEPAARRADWLSARAAAHLALARRDSRVALYDLKETIERTRHPLPVEFMAAMTAIGDVTCLESIAAAYARATAGRQPADEWSRRHLTDVFQAIVSREKLSRRHAEIRKLEKRWKSVVNELWAPLKL